MWDILYIKGKQSRNYDQELKYSLRSLEKCVSDIGRVFITGECPNFVDKSQIIWTKENDIGAPMINHWWKVRQTIKNTDISDNFVLMYDDIFFAKQTKLTNYPFYYRGELSQAKEGTGMYQRSLQNARKWLEQHNYPCLDYELHIPCVYNRDKFLKLDEAFSPIVKDFPAMAVRSVYANMFVGKTELRRDIKIRLSTECVDFRLQDADCFSVSDWVFECNTQQWLNEHYKERSRWEK